MNQVTHRKLSALAVAIGLVCGGSALADDNTDSELRPTLEQPAVQVPSDVDLERKYDSLYEDVDDPATQSPTATVSAAFLDESIQSENEISEFVAAIEKAGLADALANGTEYTIFAPTDEAFRAYSDENGELPVEELREVIRTHVVSGALDSEQARSLDSAQVLTGETVTIASDGDNLVFGEAELVSADIRSGNLTIHTIDAVLVPEAGSNSWQAMDTAESTRSQETDIGAETAEELPDAEEAE